MRSLILFLASLPAIAATCSIDDVLYNAVGGGLYSGTVTVSLASPARSQPLASGGQTVVGWQVTRTVVDGALKIDLICNDNITPAGTSYAVSYQPRAGATWSERWIAVAGKTKVIDIRAGDVPPPTSMLQPGQIAQSGATSGQALAWNGSSWIPTTIGGGTTYTASAVIDVQPVTDGTCRLDSTAVTVTGAALGGRPTIGSSFVPPEGVTLTAKISGPNSMRIEICNWSGATYDPTSATYYFGASQ